MLHHLGGSHQDTYSRPWASHDKGGYHLLTHRSISAKGLVFEGLDDTSIRLKVGMRASLATCVIIDDEAL